MKKLFYFLLLLTFATAVQAQSAPSGSAGTYYKMFYKSIDKLKVTDYEASKGSFKSSLSQAKQHLASVKKYDPDFDASQMEKDLKQYDDIANSASANQFFETDLKGLEEKMAILRASEGLEDPSFASKYDYAEAKLETLKKRNPTYDASAYEKELATFEASYKGEVKSEDDANRFDEEYQAAVGNLPSIHANLTTQEMQAKVAECEKRVNDFINSDIAAEANKRTGADKNITWTNSFLTSMFSDYFKNNTLDQNLSVHDMEADYYKMQAIYTLAKGMNTVFGKDAQVAKNFKSIDDVMRGLPSLSALKATTEKNATAEIANRKMKPAVTSDPALEAEFKQAFLAQKYTPSTNILKINIVSSNWQILRTPITEKITARERAAQFAIKEADGKCYLYPCVLNQAYNGSSYQKGTSVLNHRTTTKTEIPCENVK